VKAVAVALDYLYSRYQFPGGNMQRPATARAIYPANATYLSRIQPTEQDQGRKSVSCITRGTGLLALLSLGLQYHDLHDIQY